MLMIDDYHSLTEAEVKAFHAGERALLDSLHMNVNVFMPFLASVDSDQVEADEALAREAAMFLWDTVIPCLMKDVKRCVLTV